MKKLLGPHLGGLWANKLDVLRQWQPPLVLVLQPEVEKVAQLRAACPQAIIVGRFYHDDNHYASNIAARPKEFAREIHNEIIGNPVTPLLDYVQSNNEVCQDWQGIQQLNTYALEGMNLADQSGAYKCAILAFSVGNPDMPHKPGDPAGFDGRMLYWQQVLPSLNYAQRNDHILLLHAYGYPNMFAPDADWYIYRYERQVQAHLRTLGITDLKYVYGEIGIDRLIVNGKGGYKVVTTDQDYTNQLLQWERDQQAQSLLLGGAIFGFGDSGGWDSYDIASGGVASLIAAHYVERVNEYESSSTEGQSEPMQTHLPSVSTGTEEVDWMSPEVKIDPRIAGEIYIAEEGKPDADGRLWEIIEIKWFDHTQSGGRHHTYVEFLDEQNQIVAGVPFTVHWSTGSQPLVSNGGRDFDASNQPFSTGRAAFWVTVPNGDTVKGIGMGEMTDEGFNAGEHAAYVLTYKRRKVKPPAIEAPPPAPAEPPKEPSMQANIIEPRVAQAILNVESGGRTHGDDGRVLIRFEAHIFKTYLGLSTLWTDHFRTDVTRPWVDQYWRPTVSDTWRPIHTGKQADEWAAFDFARELNSNAATNSISMGAAQIVGFNHARIGYMDAWRMLESFESAPMQTIGFINFCLSDPALMAAMRDRDFDEVARRYNGAGNVAVYGKLLRDAYASLGG